MRSRVRCWSTNASSRDEKRTSTIERTSLWPQWVLALFLVAISLLLASGRRDRVNPQTSGLAHATITLGTMSWLTRQAPPGISGTSVLSRVVCPTAATCLAVGTNDALRGPIVRTNDAGRTWTSVAL